MNIFELYNIGKEAYKFINDILPSDKGSRKRSTKEYLGEILVETSNGCFWKVKVRRTQNRGRYLKITSKSNDSRRIRATADYYKKYSRITPEEWEFFYQLTANQKSQEHYHNAKKVLDRLTS